MLACWLAKLREKCDKVANCEDDICSVAGFGRLIALTLRLRVGGLLWGAIPCNTFSWMSRGTYGRSPTFPCGDCLNVVIKVHNCITARFCLVAMLAVVRRCFWTAEACLNTPGYWASLLYVHVNRHVTHVN